MRRRRAAWAALALLAAPPALAQSGMVGAEVAGHRYALPRALLPQDGIAPPAGGYVQAFTLQPLWPGLAPPPPDHRLSYGDGLLAILLQDISPTTRVERLASLPDRHTRFLTLWRNSTVDQFALPQDFRLERLAPAGNDAPPGLRQLGPLPEDDRLFVDGPPGRPSLLMTCRTGLSCQLWWMQNEAAVEVTFAERLLPEWGRIRESVMALLDGLRKR